jgi:hypothetical protein
MPTAPETDPDHTRAPVPVPADDAAGRLLVAMLATAGLAEPTDAERPALAESVR